MSHPDQETSEIDADNRLLAGLVRSVPVHEGRAVCANEIPRSADWDHNSGNGLAVRVRLKLPEGTGFGITRSGFVGLVIIGYVALAVAFGIASAVLRSSNHDPGL